MMKKIFLLSLLVTLIYTANLVHGVAGKPALYENLERSRSFQFKPVASKQGDKANKKCTNINSNIFDEFSKNNKLYEL